MQKFTNFNSTLYYFVKQIYETPEYTITPRGQETKEILFANFAITNTHNRLCTISERQWSSVYYYAELLWYLSGSNKLKYILPFSKFWKDISDDGITLNSAYGSRIFAAHPRIANNNIIQWKNVIDILKKDKDSRQAIIHIKVPEDDVEYTKDLPCTVYLHFFIRSNKLHLMCHKRSTDVIYGLCYDVPIFMTLIEIMANELEVETGTYYHVSDSLHLYKRHYNMAKNIIAAGEPKDVGTSLIINKEDMHYNINMGVNLMRFAIDGTTQNSINQMKKNQIRCPFFENAVEQIITKIYK